MRVAAESSVNDLAGTRSGGGTRPTSNNLGDYAGRDGRSQLGGLILDDDRVRELLDRTLTARVEQRERPIDQLQRSREHQRQTADDHLAERRRDAFLGHDA